MSDKPVATEPYEPPTIDERAPISLALIGLTTSGVDLSAAFRPL
jgi:hypothetical protein